MKRKPFLKSALNTLTVLGAGLSAAGVVFAFEGYARYAWMLMGVGLIIDSLDGTLVRVLGLEDVLTRYDGARLDEYADLVTYVVGPVLFAWATGLLPFGPFGLITGVVVCAVSCLQFSRLDNKTKNAFWGWPSYWNVLYFYCWAFEAEPVLVITSSLVLSVCVFAPIPFAYPSKLPKLKKLTYVLCGIWITALAGYLVFPWIPGAKTVLAASFLFPAYYFSLSVAFYDTLKEGKEAAAVTPE